MSFLRRISPALLLLILAPLTAEFLLGDFSVKQLALLLVLLPMYGGGALLIREIVRRTGRGWPSILLLGVAYALIEEGLATQSLFNPNYAGARLLDYGYIPALGTSLDWSVFVLSIHVVWSVATPILIAEGVAGERQTTPWLKWPGLCIAAVLYLFGCLITTRYSLQTSPFRASSAQFLTIGVLSLVAIVAAFAAFRRRARRLEASRSEESAAPAPWIVAVISLALGTAFHLLRLDGARRMMSPVVVVLTMLALEVIAVVLIAAWARRERWGARHYLAIATGTVLTYGWLGLDVFLSGHTNLGAPTGVVDDIGQIIEVLVVLGLIVLAIRASTTAALALVLVAIPILGHSAEAPLMLEAKIPLGAVSGRIDHLAFDPMRERLYVAELGNNSIGIVDLKARRVIRTVAGFDEPQGIGYEPSTDAIYVANGGDGSVRTFKGADFAPVGTIALGKDADNVRIDREAHRVYVGYGDGALAVIDPATRKRIADVPLKGHPESFQLDPAGDRIFVNIPDAEQIAVVSRESQRAIGSWPTGNLRANYPLALDAEHGRAISVFRHPAHLQAYDTSTGRALNGSNVCGDSDDVFVDAKRHRVYVICGQGVVDTLDASSNAYTRIGQLTTSGGARTGLFVPDLDRLFIAVRAAHGEAAAVWVLRPNP